MTSGLFCLTNILNYHLTTQYDALPLTGDTLCPRRRASNALHADTGVSAYFDCVGRDICICGGSAIAAIAPITNASQEEIAVSLGTVFVLNSVALLTFPAIGSALHMTQPQFGLWAALAIHDISSVVGATAKYGAVALTVGTTIKLARALWIVPLSVGTAIANNSKARI